MIFAIRQSRFVLNVILPEEGVSLSRQVKTRCKATLACIRPRELKCRGSALNLLASSERVSIVFAQFPK